MTRDGGEMLRVGILLQLRVRTEGPEAPDSDWQELQVRAEVTDVPLEAMDDAVFGVMRDVVTGRFVDDVRKYQALRMANNQLDSKVGGV